MASPPPTPNQGTLPSLIHNQQKFLTFLYGAAVSVLLARVFIHEAAGLSIQNWNAYCGCPATAPMEVPMEKYINEVLFLILAVAFISAEWLARRVSNRRLFQQPQKHVKINVLLASANWVFEIVALIIVTLAFGNYTTTFYGAHPTGNLPYLLFAGFALITFFWEVGVIWEDPLKWREIAGESFWGDITALHSVKTVWRLLYADALETKVSRRDHQGGRLNRLLASIFEGLNVFLHQYVGQHLAILNLWFFCVIVIASTVCRGGVIHDSYHLDDVGPFLIVAASCILTALVTFMVRGYVRRGSANNGSSPTQAKLSRFASLILVFGVALLHLSLSVDNLIFAMLIQQVIVVVSLFPPNLNRLEPIQQNEDHAEETRS